MSSAGEVSGLSAFENYFALELLFKSCNESLQSKEDALIVLAHYLLVRNGKRCAGIGETWDGNAQHCTTELLPPGWNENQGSYTIRYISSQNNERYLLKAVRADTSLLICVLNIKEDKTASTSLNVGKYVSEEYKDCSRPRAQEPAQLGQRDLDPFFGGRSGGGMIMDPRELTRPLHPNPGATIPGLPGATVPPGARFDPFGPSSTNDPAGFRFAGPNPDHAMRPPDYDDMFS
ncbi:proteasome inhibitor PI31 subunit-like isoform X2 [Dermacentor variabilis]|uniref:proteasome inhibitor PI31 subunit-like isoform X2 n=1 Tax=Dermacentor variabilis TaxID=34621 RepID=UPI003F5B2271